MKTAWVIELDAEPGKYLIVGTAHARPLWAWTTNRDAALQFARECDVKAFGEGIPELMSVARPTPVESKE